MKCGRKKNSPAPDHILLQKNDEKQIRSSRGNRATQNSVINAKVTSLG